MIAFYCFMRTRLCVFLLLLPAALLFACSSARDGLEGESAQRLVLQNISLVRSARAPVERARYVVVESGRIAAVGDGHYRAEPGDLVIDGKGYFVSPGLIDMHVHVFDPSDLLLLLAHGVTTARQMSGERKLLHFRHQVEKGEMPGPTLVVSSPVLNQRSRYASGPLHRFVETPAHARRLVERYYRLGYELIKVYDGLSRETYGAIAEASAKFAMPVAGHPPFNFPLDDFITPSLQSMEHTEMLFQAPLDYSYDANALQTFVEELGPRSLYVTPTLVVFDDLARLASDSEMFMRAFNDEYINPQLLKQLQPMLHEITHIEDAEEWVKKSQHLGLISQALHVHGVRLLVGSDAGYLTLSGFGTIGEMKLLQKAGIPTQNVLEFATVNAATVLVQSEELGRLHVGMQADMVITRADPRRDFNAYYSLHGVIADGVYWDEQAIGALKEGAKEHMSWFETLRWYIAERIDLWRDS